MKKFFEEPKLDVILVDDVDIITTSCNLRKVNCQESTPVDAGLATFEKDGEISFYLRKGVDICLK